MIRYTLRCADGHEFESWFQSAGAFDALARSGHLSCAVCGSPRVEKSLMAPHVAADAEASPPKRALSAPKSPAEQALAALRKHIEKSADYVGRDFATQARAMHLGDAPERPIWGETRPDEAKALLEDGVPVAPLPFRRAKDSN
ncbi:hypothetical protein OCH239_02510 [Roseivivax halodurans JCM 10272]|uniref:Uncharacterized protein n=1 Tax=Roseivivax halodurans JCM 10272 TaxID=1449350 RepID=X7EEW7_9RHOB|nr:DUF1178 family protein [Roseivivax halodurans]ETX14457.1 hypothetical protein OCH239_02510 [Roseivivax halodurans JCM 10272]